ncbi:MAG: glycoside hydrolase family 3 protein [Bacteroidota bacterium]
MYRLIPYSKASRELSLQEKVGQFFMPAAFINDSEEEIQILERVIKEQHVGGLCFFHSRASAATNYEGVKEIPYNAESLTTLTTLIQRYQKIAKHPLLISIDAEWGLAMRIEETPQYPYALTLGAISGDNDLIFEVGRHIAQDCKKAGIHWNLAPVVDINNNPANPVIGYRSFGERREQVYKKALAFIQGTQSEGILTSIKHFPGHGDTATDSHLGLPIIDKSKKALLENELYPFQKLIQDGVDSVMAGHLCVPALAQGKADPSSLSKEIIKGLLRDEMGFTGVVISDALNMHAVSKKYPVKGELEWVAFDAGNDVLCFAEHTEEGITTILERASTDQIEQSFKRIWALKEKSIPKEIPKSGQATNHLAPYELNKKLATESLTCLKGKAGDIREFLNSGFIGISVGRNADNPFFKSLAKSISLDCLSLEVEATNLLERLEGENRVLLPIFPPLASPKDSFGLTQELLQVNDLLAKKEVILYLFGNPYLLNHISWHKAKAVVIAYQDFPIFQEMAALHFLTQQGAGGNLPVALDQNISHG